MSTNNTPLNSKHKRFLFSFLIGVLIIGVVSCISLNISPWAATMIIRSGFKKNAAKVNEALVKHVPAGLTSLLNEHYDVNDADAYLDVYYPSSISNTETKLKTIVWTHGGAWISGNKGQLSNYCKILADKGFVVISIDYSIAPKKKYPTPVRQLNAALKYLLANAERLHIDTSAFFLAGDSGGSHIAAQEANVISIESYAQLLDIQPSISRSNLAGVILYCGPYDAQNISLEGEFGKFLKTILWDYSGTKNFMTDPKFASASVINYVSGSFPATFISVGNKDPLSSQSHNFVSKLQREGVEVDTLFFPVDYTPGLPHEYQFNLDNEAGNIALDHSVKFLNRTGNKK